MTETMLREIADKADMIIKGYAFTRDGDLVRVLNLKSGQASMVMFPDGTMVETNMDEIEQALVQSIWSKDSKYMEA